MSLLPSLYKSCFLFIILSFSHLFRFAVYFCLFYFLYFCLSCFTHAFPSCSRSPVIQHLRSFKRPWIRTFLKFWRSRLLSSWFLQSACFWASQWKKKHCWNILIPSAMQGARLSCLFLALFTVLMLKHTGTMWVKKITFCELLQNRISKNPLVF